MQRTCALVAPSLLSSAAHSTGVHPLLSFSESLFLWFLSPLWLQLGLSKMCGNAVTCITQCSGAILLAHLYFLCWCQQHWTCPACKSFAGCKGPPLPPLNSFPEPPHPSRTPSAVVSEGIPPSPPSSLKESLMGVCWLAHLIGGSDYESSAVLEGPSMLGKNLLEPP